MQTTVAVLALVASLFLLGTVALYLYYLITGEKVTPNPATFLIRSIVSIINVALYFQVADGSWLKTVVTVVSAAGLVGIFLYSCFKRKFSPVRILEVFCFIFAMGIVVIWWTMNDKVLANLLLQGVMLLAFWPQVNALYTNVGKELPLPWALATTAYVLMTLVVLGSPSGWAWPQLVHPIAVGILGNGALMVLAFRQNNWTLASFRIK
ncbi:MAG: hypothetical protein AAB458_00450 [Patescibacteria group bacterium]